MGKLKGEVKVHMDPVSVKEKPCFVTTQEERNHRAASLLTKLPGKAISVNADTKKPLQLPFKGQGSSPGWQQNLATLFCCTSFAGMQDVRLMRSWNFALRLERAAEARQWLAGSESLQGESLRSYSMTFLEGKLKLQWGLQEGGETRIMIHLRYQSFRHREELI